MKNKQKKFKALWETFQEKKRRNSRKRGKKRDREDKYDMTWGKC